MTESTESSSHLRVFSRCRAVAEAINEAGALFVLTGAGISVPSGIPDFRSAEGLWQKYPPEHYATINVFHRQPEKFWAMNFELFEGLKDKKPNAGHEALAEIEALGINLVIATQNIDGLHQAAGSTQVIEVHGGKDHLACLNCKNRVAVADFEFDPPNIPRCDKCNYYLKPDVTYFGEALKEEALRAAVEAASGHSVALIVGTSAVVHPAAMLPSLAAQSGATLCEFNLESTALTHSGIVSHFVEGSADESLPALVEYLKEIRPS